MSLVMCWCCRLTAVAAFASILAGCVGRHQGGAPTSEQRARAVLAAARADQISLFGDLPGTGRAGYVTRAAVSLKQHTFSDVGADFDPDVDPAGKRIVFASTRHNTHPDLYIKSVEGVAVTQLTADPASDVQPAFSPDGTRIAFASNRSGNWDIWIIQETGGPPVQVTTGPADEVHPGWSPDGTKLVFCSLPSEGGQWELWVADAVAGSTRRFIGYGLFPEWSPVGDTIVYQRARERGSRWFSVWTLTLIDGEPRYPTEVAASATQAMTLPTWSPNARQIAYAATTAGLPQMLEPPQPGGKQIFDIWIMDADGRGKSRLTDGHTMNYAPTFSPDGSLFFTSNRSGRENVWSLVPMARPSATSGDDVLTRGNAGTAATVQKASHPGDL